MLVYLDTCAVQRPLDDQGPVRIRIEAEIVLAVIAIAEAGDLDLISSDVLRFETEHNPIPARRDFARRVLAIATMDVASTEQVLNRARHYEEGGIKPLDAVHLASAVAAGANFFCTVDAPLLRKGRRANTAGTRVVSAAELIQELTP